MPRVLWSSKQTACLQKWWLSSFAHNRGHGLWLHSVLWLPSKILIYILMFVNLNMNLHRMIIIMFFVCRYTIKYAPRNPTKHYVRCGRETAHNLACVYMPHISMRSLETACDWCCITHDLVIWSHCQLPVGNEHPHWQRHTVRFRSGHIRPGRELNEWNESVGGSEQRRNALNALLMGWRKFMRVICLNGRPKDVGLEEIVRLVGIIKSDEEKRTIIYTHYVV